MATLLMALPSLAGSKSNEVPTADGDGPMESVETSQANDLIPFVLRQGACVVKIGKKSAREVDYQFEALEDGRWKSTVEGVHIVYLQRGERGETLLPREDDLLENVIVTYSPALPVLPAEWGDDRAVEGAVDMVIKNAKTGLVREKGTCSYRVELVGKQRIKTPDGEFDTIVVRETRHIRLKLAKSDVTVVNWYVPGKGEVAEHVTESTKALGILGGKKESDMRLSK